jgi:hypothetical protein
VWPWRCIRGVIALCGALLPVVATWRMIVTAMAPHDAARPDTQAPNPAKAPADLLGPWSIFAYIDPYLAGTSSLWIPAGQALFALVVLAIVVWALGVPALVRAGTGGATEPGLLKAVTVALAVGVVLAAPWLYALIWILRQPAW